MTSGLVRYAGFSEAYLGSEGFWNGLYFRNRLGHFQRKDSLVNLDGLSKNQIISDSEEVRTYENAYQIYRSLYPKLREDFYTFWGYSIESR